MSKRAKEEMDGDDFFSFDEEDEKEKEEEDSKMRKLSSSSKSPSSSLPSGSNFSFSRGSHGQQIKTQQHPREKRSKVDNKNRNKLQFAERFFSANVAEAQDHVRIYHDASKGIQEGMLSAFICLKKYPLSQALYMALVLQCGHVLRMKN
jgi:hypothetical protein